ncbi:hypothetical protein AOL_s00173g266 [Orbilia oligospora ATCC 24927]|uniref:Uncharacterized protein n=1 Tax=Arthrobotrys oligospora (strain ATCC 24927 / CBS 115.81 / DSM 1491) TaxID=756982 RepID=G1XP98_ARTOA|nr:hypothetical protein AOL_s00173g266 [Orbilia oligospora ATCC 24927]EGX45165.1 hypothetical protein AOL_s00173g266 [Orbilia oligospora ATCC 24927]
MIQRTASSPGIAIPEASSTTSSCPSRPGVKCPRENMETQVAGVEAIYPASGTVYSKSLASETLVLEIKKSGTNKEPLQPEATAASSQSTPNLQPPASQNPHFNSEDVSGKRANLGDFLLVTTIIVCRSPSDIIEMRVEEYEARDNWLHHGNPVIDELDYTHWRLQMDFLEEVWVPGRLEPRTQLLNSITKSIAECKDCMCERGDNGEPTGLLVGTGDHACPQIQADDCNVIYDSATTNELGGRFHRLKASGLKQQDRPQRWRDPGTKEPYYLEGPEFRQPERPYWSDMSGLSGALAASTADRSRNAHRYERSGWSNVPGIRKRDAKEFRSGIMFPENKGDSEESIQGEKG